MKKLSIIISCILSCLAFVVGVDAASFGATATSSTVKPNGTFTVSVGGDSIGRVNLSVTNGTLSTNSVWVEQNYQTVTVTAGSSGVVVVTATPVTGFSDSDANLYNPGSRTVSVTIVSSSNPNTTKPSTTGEKKSNNNKLSSLEIEEGKITPNFSKDVTEYTINLSKDVTSINIAAKAEDTKSKISGIGSIKVKPGVNNIKVVVTAEDGSKKTYTIKAYLDETPEIYLEYGEDKVGIVRNIDDIKLEGFKKADGVIDSKNVVFFARGETTIIYGIDGDNIKNFYMFDADTKTVLNKVYPINLNDREYLFLDNRDEKGKIDIGGVTIGSRAIGEDNYYLVKILTQEGKSVDYIYEKTEGSLQLYDATLFDKVCDKDSGLSKILLVVESLFLLAFIALSFRLYKKLERKKKR